MDPATLPAAMKLCAWFLIDAWQVMIMIVCETGDMKPFVIRARILVIAILIFIMSSIYVQANDSIEVAGDVLAYLLPVATGGLTLGYKDGKGTLQFAESMALALGSTFALKNAISERRPNHDDYNSFPSAHSSVSFSSSEFLRMRYGWEHGISAYAAAVFVAFSRMQAKQHYLHDVIAGGAIGIVSSYLFTKPYNGWHIQPDIDTKFHGLRLSRSW